MLRKNVAGQFVYFQGVDSSTGGIKSGVSWTMRRCIDGTFAAGGGTVTEDGTTGWYKCALAQADTNGNNIGYNFTGTGAVPQTINVITTDLNPYDAVRAGLTALPNANAEAAGGLYTRGTGAGQIAQPANGSIDARLADAVSHGGTLGSSTATLALSRMSVVSQSANTSALTVTGNGTGHGGVITSGAGATGDGLQVTAGSTNGNGLALTKTGTGNALAAPTSNIVLAKTTNITGFNDIAATAIVSSGAITTSGGAVSTVTNTTQLNGAATVVLTDASSDAVIADAVWNALTASYGVANSYGALVETNLDATIGSRLATAGYTAPDNTRPANFTSLAITGGGAVTVGTNNDKTGYALTAAEENAIADAILGRNVAGGSSTGRLVKEALYVLRNKAAISGGTLTVYGTDDVTPAFTAAVTTTAGDPLSAIDPA